jgi:hypothetical protein
VPNKALFIAAQIRSQPCNPAQIHPKPDIVADSLSSAVVGPALKVQVLCQKALHIQVGQMVQQHFYAAYPGWSLPKLVTLPTKATLLQCIIKQISHHPRKHSDNTPPYEICRMPDA